MSLYARAAQDYDRATAIKPDQSAVYADRGFVRFYLGDFAKAADDFARLAPGDSSNAYQTLWLYLARARAGSKGAKEELTQGAQRLNQSEWPYPVIAVFFEQRPPEAAQAAAANSGEKCEAQFYIGEWQVLKKDSAGAMKALQAAADSCPKDFVEYRGAVAELKRLGQ